MDERNQANHNQLSGTTYPPNVLLPQYHSYSEYINFGGIDLMMKYAKT